MGHAESAIRPFGKLRIVPGTAVSFWAPNTAFPTRQLLDEPALHWSECNQDLIQNRRDENAVQWFRW